MTSRLEHREAVPLEAPGDSPKQRAVLRAALDLASAPGPGPLLVDYVPDAGA